MQSSDPRKPFLFGIIGLGALMLIGLVWAVVFLPSESKGSNGKTEANVSFQDTDDPTFGPAGAKVVIRIFEDFECPACQLAAQGIDHVREAYGDRVRVVWNDFPLESSHPNARIAANAARCAEEQGKFWEYGDALYGTQDIWVTQSDPTDAFISYAKQLGLNDVEFAQCVVERRYDAKIASDIKEALANRVDATPTFFINNTRFAGALDADAWDKELKKALGE